MYKTIYLMLMIGLVSACATFPQPNTSSTTNYTGTSYSQQAAIVERYIERTVTPKDYQQIKEPLEAEIIEWIDYYTNTAIFTDNDYEISRKLIFNDKKTEVVVLVTVQLSHNNDGRVKIVTGKKSRSGQWDFTLTGMNYHYATDEPYTRYQLESKTFHQMALEGLVEQGKVKQDRIKELCNMWVSQ